LIGVSSRGGTVGCRFADASAAVPHELHAGVRRTFTHRRSIGETQRGARFP
jgi:hypothetical protein